MTNTASWFDALEARRRWLISVTVALCLVAIIATSLSHWLNPDSYWHLRMGMDWVENGLSPWQDHYSFTHPGEPVRSPPVVFQAGYYALVNVFGHYGGSAALKILAFGLLLACLVLWMRQVHAPALVYLLVLPMAVGAMQSRAMIRPELISYSLSIIALMLYHRSQLRLTVGAMLPIAVLMWLWTNHHSSIFGYIIFFGLFVDIAIRLYREKAPMADWATWLAWGALLTALGFLNPDLSHVAVEQLRFADEWRAMIVEFRFPAHYLKYSTTYVLIAVGLLSLLLAVKQRKFGYVAILVVFFNAGMTISRMIPPMSIVCLAIFAHLLADARLGRSLSSWARPPRTAVAVVVASVIATFVYFDGKTAWRFLNDELDAAAERPDALVAHMQSRGLHGRVFNDYGLGGYLIYHLSPEIQVFIDGRTNILYPLDTARSYFAAQTQPQDLSELTERFDIDFAIMKAQTFRARTALYAGYRLEYPDAAYALFGYGKGQYATLGYTWVAPYCWDANISGRLSAEVERAEQSLAPSSHLMPLAELARGFIQASDKARFLADYDIDRLTTDNARRFFVYRALENDAYDLAVQVGLEIRGWEFRDALARILALIRTGDLGAARENLQAVISTPPSQAEYSDLIVQQALLASLDSRRSLAGELARYHHSLTAQLGDQTLAASGTALSVAAFCEPGLRQLR